MRGELILQTLFPYVQLPTTKVTYSPPHNMFPSRLARLSSRTTSILPSSVVKSFSSSVKPFRILGLQQIALGSLSLDGLSSLWIDTFEAKEVKRFKSEKENVDEIVTEIGRGLGKVEIDLMMPLGTNGGGWEFVWC